MKGGLIALGAATLALTFGIASQAREQKVEGLKPVVAFASIADRNARSTAIFEEMGKVIQHPRCVNCHPRTDRPLQGDAQVPHVTPVTRGPEGKGAPGLECATCHGPRNVAFANGTGSIPGHPEWHLAPIEMAWEGKTLAQICAQIKDRKRNGGKSLEQLIEHNAHDSLVGWGWNPGPGRQPAPGTQAEFGELTRAWVASGAACPKG
ncbi:Isoquinoline 1-oxidoreductase subunit [Sphingomonas sp. M1-B02]|uniref:Isoquinoline 1-oxidoreductase subunit n=1 Tax=Sphingomonas sp. M1-B02 TaxID=3114300 RepID=UPI002240052F|nr:Isoquinoline 1-oxidoreductase subunit [Sphingomonas sp. S6-11]UZK65830.1 Isoquinoline 1-oxidoreductase subunit [Sphingomonas sp. S6-11]